MKIKGYRSPRRWIWECNCGSGSMKALPKRWKAVNYAKRHHNYEHGYDPDYHVTVTEVLP